MFDRQPGVEVVIPRPRLRPVSLSVSVRPTLSKYGLSTGVNNVETLCSRIDISTYIEQSSEMCYIAVSKSYAALKYNIIFT